MCSVKMGPITDAWVFGRIVLRLFYSTHNVKAALNIISDPFPVGENHEDC